MYSRKDRKPSLPCAGARNSRIDMTISSWGGYTQQGKKGVNAEKKTLRDLHGPCLKKFMK